MNLVSYRSVKPVPVFTIVGLLMAISNVVRLPFPLYLRPAFVILTTNPGRFRPNLNNFPA
jgi:hypothetical protein